jgi:NADH-quinone oxidoreductase E subunit
MSSLSPAPSYEDFDFSSENQEKITQILTHYPAGRQASAVLPLLDLAQRQCGGWLPQKAMDRVAQILHMPPVRVYEVASFYTMFNLKPVGKYLIQVCTTTPCGLRGAEEIKEACHSFLQTGPKEVTPEGLFSWMEVECLGACVNGPVVQINDDYIEDLTPHAMTTLLQDLKTGKTYKPGSILGRQGSKPLSSSAPQKGK